MKQNTKRTKNSSAQKPNKRIKKSGKQSVGKRPLVWQELTNTAASEPEISALHLQEPNNGPYPEPGESTPYATSQTT
jgi:hypothetical protein